MECLSNLHLVGIIVGLIVIAPTIIDIVRELVKGR